MLKLRCLECIFLLWFSFTLRSFTSHFNTFGCFFSFLFFRFSFRSCSFAFHSIFLSVFCWPLLFPFNHVLPHYCWLKIWMLKQGSSPFSFPSLWPRLHSIFSSSSSFFGFSHAAQSSPVLQTQDQRQKASNILEGIRNDVWRGVVNYIRI